MFEQNRFMFGIFVTQGEKETNALQMKYVVKFQSIYFSGISKMMEDRKEKEK
jgi:hypothetical protein